MPADKLVLPAVLAVVSSLVLAESLRRWAVRRDLLDHPNHRSSHVVPTPRGGGIGIVAGFLLGLGLWVGLGGVLSARAVGWITGGTLVAAVSFVDDLHPLPARVRLPVHLLGALLLAAAGIQGDPPAIFAELTLAFLWVALLTNIYNFMDGVDALATSQAIIAGLAYAAAGALAGNPLVVASGVLIGSAGLGFLPLNLPPARVFMGDVSSTFLGFSFAALGLLANLGVGGNKLPLEFGAVVLAPFLFDGVVTLSRRALRGERLYEAHRTHFYQRLTIQGLTHGQVTALYAGCAVIAAACALLALGDPWQTRAILDAAAYLPMLGIALFTYRLEHRGTSVARRSTG